MDHQRRPGRPLGPGRRLHGGALDVGQRPRAADLAEEPGPDARAVHALMPLGDPAVGDGVGIETGELGRVGRRDVGAGAHDDVDAARPRDPGERQRVAADAGDGRVDDRRPAAGHERRELGDGQRLVVEDEVVGVVRPVPADPAEVLEGERPVCPRAVGRVLGLDEGRVVDEQMFVDERRAEGVGRDRSEDGSDDHARSRRHRPRLRAAAGRRSPMAAGQAGVAALAAGARLCRSRRVTARASASTSGWFMTRSGSDRRPSDTT